MILRTAAAVLLTWAVAAVTYPALTGAHHHRAAVRQEQESSHG